MAHRLHDPDCGVSQALALFGDNWTFLVLREAFLGTRRFADFRANLGISKNVLSERLAHLVDNEVLEKIDAGKFGQRFEYQLTPKGLDLTTVVTALRQWADRWVFGSGREPLLVVDRETGEPILPVRIRRQDGSAIPGSDLEFRLGPGATNEMKRRASERG